MNIICPYCGNNMVWQSDFNYEEFYGDGEGIEVNNFDTNRWNECSTGIHHFITRKEAAKY